MVSKVRSLGISGIRGYEVSVECFLSSGLPAFDIVGLPDAAVKESRDRVRAAIKNCGLSFPVSRLTVNLAPADTKKIGTVYDLPVLLGILISSGVVKQVPEDHGFFGELSLSGELRPVNGALPMALGAQRCGITKLFIPADNAPEAAYANGLEVYPVSRVEELIAHLAGETPIEPLRAPEYVPQREYALDFSDVKGQENVKRALEIAAAGGHNILLCGPPGSGKSMLARRLPSILPEMTREETLESTEIYSVAGLVRKETPVLAERPFRSPHHTVSSIAMSGGGSALRPGEVSLSHNGVLFLDELPEFPREVLEVLRQPLEDGSVTISRVSGVVTYPCNFMLVCAMNPCKCGWLGHESGKCRCSEAEIARYNNRISGPMLDRIDMLVEVPALDFEELKGKTSSESSAEIRKRVNRAREIQNRRFGSGTGSNARMGQKEIQKYCALDEEGERLMRRAYDRMGLTGRSYDRILKVARTIADLDGTENIAGEHFAEAIQYRAMSAWEN